VFSTMVWTVCRMDSFNTLPSSVQDNLKLR